jgi:hypothetical protein
MRGIMRGEGSGRLRGWMGLLGWCRTSTNNKSQYDARKINTEEVYAY